MVEPPPLASFFHARSLSLRIIGCFLMSPMIALAAIDIPGQAAAEVAEQAEHRGTTVRKGDMFRVSESIAWSHSPEPWFSGKTIKRRGGHLWMCMGWLRRLSDKSSASTIVRTSKRRRMPA